VDASFSPRNFEYLRSVNAEYIDEVYARYLENPNDIDPSWKYFFDGIYLGEATVLAKGPSTDWVGELKVYQLIFAYQTHGHFLAKVNPIYANPDTLPELELSRFGLSDADLDRTFSSAAFLGLEPAPLKDILAYLRKVYCGPVGIELLQIQDSNEREWVEKKIESLAGNYTVSREDKEFIFRRLTESETLERFIHTRYVAQKRFSIEGGEALIPALDCVIEAATGFGAEEIVLGMAHRGRLNVMVNILKKPPEYLFTEFDDNYRLSTDDGEGDVKYHKGYSYDAKTRQGKNVHLSLGFNPSHLEFVNPVAMGMTRAKQYQHNDTEKNKVVSILMHGDAAFSGQGVVYESLQGSKIEGYDIGGTIHFISNNQVGFTTDPKDGRSTHYCTDLARMLDVPIFHVNGDDPEALWIISKLAVEYRNQFKKDVVIDVICYRRYGHNEGDEPSFTQPTLYQAIAQHPNPREVYGQRLVSEGLLTDAEVQAEQKTVMDKLQAALEKVRSEKPEPYYTQYTGPFWSKYHHAHGEDLFAPVDTSVPANELVNLSQIIDHFPPNFTLHPKLERLFSGRLQAIEQGKGIDWGNAEVLAYASLIKEGTTVRMSGQDVRRGTFTHRHAAVCDYHTNEALIPVNQIPSKAKFLIYNSYLSETAVMGFEYGWSVADPDSLTVWEAQFGDFANGAQVIIDQFLAASESKWHRSSGLTLLLPHGFEGQGPEHSSARLERFLQLCGKNNMTVAYPTTPAQMFHLLRRQVKRPFRKPLIVMTPKSLLRHPKAVSELTDLSNSNFKEVIDDSLFVDPQMSANVTRIMICAGKIYYDLHEERETRLFHNVAIVRLEQLYPWPEHELARIIEKYPNAKEIFFVQEEPRNMGAWTYFQGMWGGALANFGVRFPKLGLTYVGREVCAAPAVGSKKLHDKEQREIVLRAFQA